MTRLSPWLPEGPRQLRLRLLDRVLFVDWYGVLSSEVFWPSIRRVASHPLHAALTAACDRLFRAEKGVVDDWMRGRLTSKEVIDTLAVDLGARGEGFLLRRLERDCRQMAVEKTLLAEVRALRSRAYLVIATDNMDCFVTHTVPALASSLSIFDDVLCSSTLGTLKSDSAAAFFGGWLAQHGLGFQHATLLDDSRTNCEMFSALGGRAIPFSGVDRAIADLRHAFR